MSSLHRCHPSPPRPILVHGGKMNIQNASEGQGWFTILETSDRTQTAVMTLAPGKSSGDEPEAHKSSDQVLIVLKGEVEANVEGETKILRQYDSVLIPAGRKHKFTNKSGDPCVTFNTYSPPEY